MATVKHPVYIFSALAGCALAAFLVVSEQYHPDTASSGLITYGWFSPRVEKAITTDLLVPTAVAGAGTASFVRGELEASLSSGLDSVVNAFNRAIPQLQLTKVSETRTASSVVIITRTIEDMRVEVRLSTAADNVTKVVILAGDELMAWTIFDKTKASLMIAGEP